MIDTLRAQLQLTLGPAYTLERELRGGGMSRVFVARETALGRDVVVKVLAPELAASVSVERFTREIATAARLQQANIVPVLAAGVSDGVPYYTMPFVKGESLRALLSNAQPLSMGDRISVLRDVARALAYAHAEGVIHRDIKPDNILLSGGAAVVTDFGIAKAISASRTLDGQAPKSADGTLTQEGSSIGTPAYMAPEQAVGDTIDQRADLYAWGVVAYELLSGAHPFAGKSGASQLIAAHIAETPASLAERNSEIPRDVAELVMQCLAKTPTQRPANANALLSRLFTITTPSAERAAGVPRSVSRTPRAPRTLFVALTMAVLAAVALYAWRSRGPSNDVSVATAARNIETLAVLPFVNVSGDAREEYFSDGITDELTNALSKLPGLRLAGRSSSFAFKGKNVSAKEIGQQLDVAALIEGTVRRAAGRVRITVQLTSAADGKTLWQNSYENDKGDVFQVQDEVAAAIVTAVAPTLRGNATAVMSTANRGTRDTLAYDLYLQGRYLFAKRDRASLARALTMFRAAIARDSTFARAYAGIGLVYGVMPSWDAQVNPDSINRLASENARRALALDSSLVDAYSVLGLATRQAGRLDEALTWGRKAVQVDPSDATASQWLARTYQYVGDLNAARSEFRRAVALDPLSNTIANNELEFLNAAGEFDVVRQKARRILERDSLHYNARWNLAVAYLFSGAPDSALSTIREAATVPSGIRGESGLELFTLAALGRWPDAERLRTRIAQRASERSSRFDDVLSALAFGNRTEAMDIIVANREELMHRRDWFPSPACDPILSALRSDPRLIAIFNRLQMTPCTKPVPWPIAPRPASTAR